MSAQEVVCQVGVCQRGITTPNPWQEPYRDDCLSDGTHPTGMHSCTKWSGLVWMGMANFVWNGLLWMMYILKGDECLL